jgi:hypothetical protein
MRRILALVSAYRNPLSEQTDIRLYASYDKGESFFLLANTGYSDPAIYDLWLEMKLCSSPYGPTCAAIESLPNVKIIRFVNGSPITISTPAIGVGLGTLQSLDFVSGLSWIVCGTLGEYSVSYDDCLTWSVPATFAGFVPGSPCVYRASNGVFAAAQQSGFVSSELVISTDGLHTFTSYNIPDFLMHDMIVHSSKMFLVGRNLWTANPVIVDLDPATGNYSVLYDQPSAAMVGVTQSKSFLTLVDAGGAMRSLASSIAPGEIPVVVSPAPFTHPDERITSDDNDCIAFLHADLPTNYCVTASSKGWVSWQPPLLPGDDNVSIASVTIEDKALKEIRL